MTGNRVAEDGHDRGNTVTGNPQRAGELTSAARALLTDPWRTAEADRDLFTLIRRHADTLDRWFTQRLGYRLVLAADTARLVKSGYLPRDRPMRSHTGRALAGREYTALALVLAATASGPDRISLRDLVLRVRSAAADAAVALGGGPGERRALVTALRWLIERGVVRELDRSVGGYETDADADALLEIRNDRLAMLAAPALSGAATADDLLGRAGEPSGGRAATRRRIVEEPVLYVDDVTSEDWAELRRRFGEEAGYLSEMFDLDLEVRADGVAAIDADGGCSDVAFPAGGTTGHAALLLLEALVVRHRDGATQGQIDDELAELVRLHGRHWRKDATESPARLRDEAVELLVAMRLVEIVRASAGRGDSCARLSPPADPLAEGTEPGSTVRPLPAAARYSPEVILVPAEEQQARLL